MLLVEVMDINILVEPGSVAFDCHLLWHSPLDVPFWRALNVFDHLTRHLTGINPLARQDITDTLEKEEPSVLIFFSCSIIAKILSAKVNDIISVRHFLSLNSF